MNVSFFGLGVMFALAGCAAAPTDESEATGAAFTAGDKAVTVTTSAKHATFSLDGKECTVPAANVVLSRGIQGHGWTATAIADSCDGQQMILTVSGSDDARYPQTKTKPFAGQDGANVFVRGINFRTSGGGSVEITSGPTTKQGESVTIRGTAKIVAENAAPRLLTFEIDP